MYHRPLKREPCTLAEAPQGRMTPRDHLRGDFDSWGAVAVDDSTTETENGP